MDKHLHIITHDVPWPVDFGGVADLFYKIKALHSLGIKIHLHCYTSGRPEQKILDKYCASVHYYKRKKGFSGISMKIPYIVQSRNDDSLLKNLQEDKHPVLLEGIHCTYLLYNGQLQHRKVFVRLHNVEYKYYQRLAKLEKNLLRKTYFKLESRLLKKYEQKLAKKAIFWCVSNEDADVYKNELHAAHTNFLPVFLPWEEYEGISNMGDFCLYHGNLSVNENEKAAGWLLNNVFNDINIQLIIAGKNPSAALTSLVANFPNASLIADPSENAMQDLIQKARVNVLPSFNNTGVKLKLLNALFNGKYCLVNHAAAAGTGMEVYCSIAETAVEFKSLTIQLYGEKFTEEKIRQRAAGLKDIYDWEKNARKIIAWIY